MTAPPGYLRNSTLLLWTHCININYIQVALSFHYVFFTDYVSRNSFIGTQQNKQNCSFYQVIMIQKPLPGEKILPLTCGIRTRLRRSRGRVNIPSFKYNNISEEICYTSRLELCCFPCLAKDKNAWPLVSRQEPDQKTTATKKQFIKVRIISIVS